LTCFALLANAGPRGLPAQEGILNFGKVTEGLYRGAQPDTNAILNLKRLGIRAIINLRQPGSTAKIEAAAAQAAGLFYTNFPLSGISAPRSQQVREILATIESLPGPVFVHCAHGCDRTGTIVACYRIQHDKWSAGTALEEAERYGLSSLERGMRQYVMEFGKTPKPVGEKVAGAKVSSQ
jgi:protein tyrosine/serine phosphatase